MDAAKDRRKHQTFWLVPADLKARAVLRWYSKPRELDIYVVPVGTGLQWKDVKGLVADCFKVGPQNPVLEQGQSVIQMERMSDAHPDPNSILQGSEGEEFGPKSVTLDKASSGQYRIYVQAPPLSNQMPVMEGKAGQPCQDKVFVDIYINSLYYTTHEFNAGYTKWWYVGYFLKPDGQSMQWQPESRIVTYDPANCIAFPLAPVLFSVRTAGKYTAQTEFSDLKYTVTRVEYAAEQACDARQFCGLTCELMFQKIGVEMCYKTLSQVVPTVSAGCFPTYVQGFAGGSNVSEFCPRICKHQPCALHSVVAAGFVGQDSQPCSAGTCCLEFVSSAEGPECKAGMENEVWDQTLSRALYLPTAYYYVVFERNGYVTQLKNIRVLNKAQMKVDVLMIPMPLDSKEIIVVLTWSAAPLDLDLWIITEDGNRATWWDNRGPNDGVRLDTDNQDGFGPEVITFTKTTSTGRYRIAANVYSANNGVNSNDERTCKESDGDVCRFQGLETVSFYGSRAPSLVAKGGETFSGLLARSVMPPGKTQAENLTAYAKETAHSWWLAATVERKPNGESLINTLNQVPPPAPGLFSARTCLCAQNVCAATCLHV